MCEASELGGTEPGEPVTLGRHGRTEADGEVTARYERSSENGNKMAKLPEIGLKNAASRIILAKLIIS